MNYGAFLRILRNYCINKKIKNEVLVNDPIEVIVNKAKIKKEKSRNPEEPLYYEISESSRIVNSKLDISIKIREALRREGMEQAIIDSFEAFYEDNIDKTLTGDMIDEYLTYIEKDPCFKKKEISDIKAVTNDPHVFLAKLLIKSLKENNNHENHDKSIIWSVGNSYVRIIKGDIFTYALGKRSKKQRIVVIPVNTAFDAHVSTKLESDSKPLVSKTTLHGELLSRIYKSGIDESDINKRIRNNLRSNGLLKGKKKKIDLPIGTIAALEFGSAVIYMLAVSSFDENNKAHSSKEEIRQALHALLEYYDNKGQGYDVYIPLIGTGMSRARCSNQESLDLILDVLKEKEYELQGRYNIVILPDVMKKVSIREEL